MAGLMDYLSGLIPGPSAPPGGYAPTTNVFGAPALAPSYTPMQRDLTGDALPAGVTPPAAPAVAPPRGGQGGNNGPPGVRTIAKGGVLSLPAAPPVAPGAVGRARGVGMPALAPAAPAVMAPTPPAATPVPVTPSPAPPQPAGGLRGDAGGGPGFANVSPIVAQALAAFLPRQRQPIEQAQQTITDQAEAAYRAAVAKLGAGATQDDYARLMSQYEQAVRPVTIGGGMPGLLQTQFNQGMPG